MLRGLQTKVLRVLRIILNDFFEKSALQGAFMEIL